MKKVLTCIASLVPLIGVAGGFCVAMIYLVFIELSGGAVNIPFMVFVYSLLGVGVLMCWVDIIWFIILALKNKKLSDTEKLVWGLLLYLVNILVFPVFWFMVIRKEE